MKKRMVAVILAAVMGMTLLAGCGDKKADEASTAPDVEESAPEQEGASEEIGDAETPAENEETLDADVQAIVDRGVLRVGVKNAVVGFGYEDPLTGEYTGMEIDLANMIAESLGVDVEFTTVTAATRTELLDSGDIDCVLATFTITDERKLSWDFSTPYFTDHVGVLVEDASGITDLNLLIDIENSIKAQQSRGYEQWAKIHNLKQAAKTMNFLTENKIEQYADLLTRIEEITAASEQAGDSLKDVEKRLSDMAVLIKNVTTYQKTKPLYEAYRKARNKEKYRAEHERGIILHEAAAKALKAAQIGGKLPNVPALQAEYEKLQAQKESLYADYGKLKKQVQEYDVIKRNIDSILQAEKQPERERQTERE